MNGFATGGMEAPVALAAVVAFGAAAIPALPTAPGEEVFDPLSLRHMSLLMLPSSCTERKGFGFALGLCPEKGFTFLPPPGVRLPGVKVEADLLLLMAGLDPPHDLLLCCPVAVDGEGILIDNPPDERDVPDFSGLFVKVLFAISVDTAGSFPAVVVSPFP